MSGARNLKKLDATHQRAAQLLLQGGTAETIAEALEVSPHTVSEWKRSPRFKRYFRKLRREAYDESIAILQAAARQAVAVLVESTQLSKADKVQEGGRPDLALQAARMVIDISAKWADNDLTERVENLERKAKRKKVD